MFYREWHKIRCWLLALSCLVVLGGCAGWQTQQVDNANIESNAVWMTNDIALTLLPPASLGHELAVLQSLHVTVGDANHELLAQMEVSQEQLVLVGMTTSSIPLFTLSYSQAGIALEKSPLLIGQKVDAIAAENILADIQLALWPEGIVRQSLRSESSLDEGAGVVFKGYVEGDQRFRDVIDNDELVLRISYSTAGSQAVHVIENFSRGYRIVVTTLQSEAL